MQGRVQHSCGDICEYNIALKRVFDVYESSRVYFIARMGKTSLSFQSSWIYERLSKEKYNIFLEKRQLHVVFQDCCGVQHAVLVLGRDKHLEWVKRRQ